MIRDLYVGRHLALRADGPWEFAERTHARGAVLILAFTAQDELLLVEQYRAAVRRRVISLPAGLTGDGDAAENPAQAAQRELEEETGYHAERVQPLAVSPSSPGLTSELVTFFRAEGVTKIENAQFDEHEQITLHVVPRAQLRAWLWQREAEGLCIDHKIHAALQLAAWEENG